MAKRNTGKRVNLDKEIRRYLTGFLFIMVGVVAVGLTTYISSLIPPMTLSPTGVQNNTPTLGSPAEINYYTYSGNLQQLWFNPIAPPNSSTELVVVIDISNLTPPDPCFGRFHIYGNNWVDASWSWGQANNHSYVWATTTANIDAYLLGTTNSHSSTPITLYVFVEPLNANITATIIDNTLYSTSSNSATFSVSSGLFLNILGFATGIVFMVAGISRLGVKV